jgi:soluble lytic murein transglycosylase-like protein
MNTERYRRLINAAAELATLPPWVNGQDVYAPGEWLEGLILHESAGNPKALRYEAHQDLDAPGDPDAPGADDGLLEDDKSYGLMQVMGYNARRLCGVPDGTPMNFAFLLLPMTNMAFGLRILLGELGATGGDVPSALARYNGGPSGNPRGGRLRNQDYVDGVAADAARVQLARALKGA